MTLTIDTFTQSDIALQTQDTDFTATLDDAGTVDATAQAMIAVADPKLKALLKELETLQGKTEDNMADLKGDVENLIADVQTLRADLQNGAISNADMAMRLTSIQSGLMNIKDKAEDYQDIAADNLREHQHDLGDIYNVNENQLMENISENPNKSVDDYDRKNHKKLHAIRESIEDITFAIDQLKDMNFMQYTTHGLTTNPKNAAVTNPDGETTLSERMEATQNLGTLETLLETDAARLDHIDGEQDK